MVRSSILRRVQDLLIIIPAFNEADSIAATVAEVRAAVDYDFIVVNDGSSDDTARILDREGIPHLDLPINLGIGGAMQTGYRYAYREGYQYAAQLDGDGQHDPKDLPRLAHALESGGHDMVIGSRFVEERGYRGGRARRSGIYYFQHLIRFLTGLRVTDPTSGFRLVNRRVIEEFVEHYPVDYPEVEVVVSLARRDYRLAEVPVDMRDRAGGVSSITAVRSLYYMAKVTLFLVIRRLF